MSAGVNLPRAMTKAVAEADAAGVRALARLDDLVASHQRRIFSLALRLLGDADEAATATQDCFLRAFRALSRCPADETGRGWWLVRLCTNLCLDRLRSRKWKWWRQRLGLQDYDAAEPCSPLTSPERELLARELAGRLEQALGRLSPRQRAVFVLRHYEGLSLAEIGDQLGLRAGTVKAHLARATGNLREELTEYYGHEKQPARR